MALPDIRIRITGDESGGVAATERARAGVDRLAGSARRAAAPLGRLATGLQTARRRSGGMGRGVQNAAFQMGDFAVQVGAGTDATRALALQLPQLLGGFGVLGAVAGAAVAILIPLRAAMQGLSSDGDSVTRMFGTLQPVAEAVATAFGQIGPIATQMAEVLVNNLDRIILTAGVAAAFFGARWVAAFVAARVATFTLSGALIALRGALIRTGIGALIVGAGELVYQFTRLVKASGGFGEALALLKDVAIEVWQRIGDGTRYVRDSVKAMAAGMTSTFFYALHDMLAAFNSFIGSVASGINAVFGTSLSSSPLTEALTGLNQRGSDALVEQQDASAGAAAAADRFAAPLESLGKIREMLQGMKDDRITLPDILGVGGEDDEKTGGGKKKDSLKDKLKGQEKRIAAHLKRIKALTTGTLSDKLGAWGDYFTNLIALTGSNNNRLLALGKAFAAAQATVEAWKAYTATLSDPAFTGRPWARIAAAAQVLAAGIGAVNAIRSVTSGGGGRSTAGSAGGGGASAGTAGSAAAPPQELPVQQLEVVWRGPGMEMAEQMFEMMNAASRKGYRLHARVIEA